MSREIDKEIAEKVMGWDYDEDGDFHPPWYVHEKSDQKLQIAVPTYSTDIKAAWEVVEKLANSGTWLEILPIADRDPQGYYLNGFRVQFNGEKERGGNLPYTMADTAPMAICLAALKMVNGKI